MEEETGVMCLQAREPQGLPEPPEARKRQGRILPREFQKEHGSANTLISDSRTVRK